MSISLQYLFYISLRPEIANIGHLPFFFFFVKLDVRHQFSSPTTLLRTGLSLFMLDKLVDLIFQK